MYYPVAVTLELRADHAFFIRIIASVGICSKKGIGRQKLPLTFEKYFRNTASGAVFILFHIAFAPIPIYYCRFSVNKSIVFYILVLKAVDGRSYQKNSLYHSISKCLSPKSKLKGLTLNFNQQYSLKLNHQPFLRLLYIYNIRKYFKNTCDILCFFDYFFIILRQSHQNFHPCTYFQINKVCPFVVKRTDFYVYTHKLYVFTVYYRPSHHHSPVLHPGNACGYIRQSVHIGCLHCRHRFASSITCLLIYI